MKQPVKRNGAATPNQATQATVPLQEVATGEKPTAIQMPAEMLEALSQLSAQANQLKLQLADHVITMRVIEDAVRARAEEFTQRIASFARAHGIDPNNPELGRWNFDLPTGVLSRVG